MRLIDADAFKDILMEMQWWGSSKDTGTIEEIRYRLKQQPTVDAVPVVWCKDCEHGNRISGHGLVSCGKSTTVTDCIRREDWFCPLGKHRDGD